MDVIRENQTVSLSPMKQLPSVEPGGVEPGGVEPGGVEPGGVEPGGVEPGGVEPGGTISVLMSGTFLQRRANTKRRLCTFRICSHTTKPRSTKHLECCRSKPSQRKIIPRTTRPAASSAHMNQPDQLSMINQTSDLDMKTTESLVRSNILRFKFQRPDAR